MSAVQELTQTERSWLEHLRRAKSQGVTLVEYARAQGIKVGGLYEARRTLQRKGVSAPATTVPPVAVLQKPKPFVPIRVIPAVVSGGEAVCRLRHPSGWVIECGSWPDPRWMAGLMGERP